MTVRIAALRMHDFYRIGTGEDARGVHFVIHSKNVQSFFYEIQT